MSGLGLVLLQFMLGELYTKAARVTYAYLPGCFVTLDVSGRLRAWFSRRRMASGAVRASLDGFRVVPFHAFRGQFLPLREPSCRFPVEPHSPTRCRRRCQCARTPCTGMFPLSGCLCEYPHALHSGLVPRGFTSVTPMPNHSAAMRNFRSIAPCRMNLMPRFNPFLWRPPRLVIASRLSRSI